MTKYTTLIFVLLILVTANCFRNHNTFLTQTSTSFTPSAENVIVLGEAANFAILAGSMTTNAGITTVDGSIGVSPGTAISGTAVKLVSGEFHIGDTVSAAAQTALLTAFNNLKNLQGAEDMTGTDLVGLTLSPGLYKFNVEAALSGGILTLDAKGDHNAKWVFQCGTTFIAEVNSTVRVTNGGSALNVYWQVGTAATFKTGTVMAGNVLAHEDISFGTGATLHGRALARDGGVTMLSNVIEVKP